jgi:uncharacterized protein
MKVLYRLRLAVALCAALAVAACSSPNPNLYTIAAVPGPELSGGPNVVALHGVGVARYLQRNQVVRSSENYRVELSGNDWWGEPLESMLARVLREDLSQRLPGSTIYTSSGAVTGSPDATVEVEVQRLDLDSTGSLLLIAQASVSPKNKPNPDTRSFRISQPPPSPGVGGEVAAISTALGQMADRIAGMLVADSGHK